VIVESEGKARGISVSADQLIAAIDERTLIVATGHVYFRSGAIQDLARVAQRCRQVGAYSLGDGYQSVGAVPLDVTAMGIDFYVGGSHKWLCGGPGAGFLYVRPELIPKLEPRLTGWFGAQDPFKYRSGTRYPLASGVFRFLGGTPALPAIYAAREGVRTVIEAGLPQIRQRSIELTELIIREADARGIEVRSPRNPAERSGMVCLEFPGSEAATHRLGQAHVIVDWRPHCGIRVSPHFYNRPEEIGVFFRELDRCRS
jgi:kynureninase